MICFSILLYTSRIEKQIIRCVRIFIVSLYRVYVLLWAWGRWKKEHKVHMLMSREHNSMWSASLVNSLESPVKHWTVETRISAADIPHILVLQWYFHFSSSAIFALLACCVLWLPLMVAGAYLFFFFLFFISEFDIVRTGTISLMYFLCRMSSICHALVVYFLFFYAVVTCQRGFSEDFVFFFLLP